MSLKWNNNPIKIKKEIKNSVKIKKEKNYNNSFTAALTSSKLSVGSNLLTTFPSLSTKNLVKFHLMSSLSL